jgi:hypothetical protein
MMAPIAVQLNEGDIQRSVKVANQRYENARSRSYRQTYELTGDHPEFDLHGALGECAFHKGLGLHWSELVGTFKLPDARWNIQIRCAPCKARRPPAGFGRLMIHPGFPQNPKADDPRDYFALVVGNTRYFSILGWILGRNGMRAEWFDKPAPTRAAAWFVPQRVLNRDFSRILDGKT